MSKEIMQQALGALERIRPQVLGALCQADVVDAIDALRAALAEPETTCRRAICQRGPDGYCAPCHERMYP